MLRWLGLPVAIAHVEIDETPRPGEPPAELAARLAVEKARAAQGDGWVLTADTVVELDGRNAPDPEVDAATGTWVLTADTVVELDGRMLDKPAGAAEARATLEALRGRRHLVHTAVALARAEAEAGPGPRASRPHAPVLGRTSGCGRTPVRGRTPVLGRVRRVTTEVQMRAYTDAEIDAYIATGDPLDKAGAYAIQHPTFAPVAHLHVCYANVVGLPLCAVLTLIESVIRTPSEARNPNAFRGAQSAIPNVPSLCLRHFNYDCPAPDIGEARP